MANVSTEEFYASIQLGPLESANHLLGMPELLTERLQQDGYLYLRSIIPQKEIHKLHSDFISIFQEQGLIREGTQANKAITDCVPLNEGEDGYFKIYDQIQKLEAFHALAHTPSLIQLLRDAVGPSVFPHPQGVARLSFPSNEECATPPHQDYPNNQGTPELYASWIPLTDCPQEMGGLALLPSSHTQGLLPLKYALGPGNRQAVLSIGGDKAKWLSTDFKSGDVLIFHSHTVHCALPNRSDRMRLSVDYRYQHEEEPLTERCLQPHFGRLTWDEIYKGWKSEKLKFYWEKLSIITTPWSEEYHSLPDDHIKEAVKINRAYQQKRELLNNDS